MKNLVGAVIDCALFDEQEKKKDRKRSGKWSPSSLGRCYRYQVWNRQDKPVSNPIGIETLRIFQVGHLFHKFVQDKFVDAKKEVKVETDCLLGFADIVLDDEVIDIKSVRSYGFALMKENGTRKYRSGEIKPAYKVEEDKYGAILQVMTYAHYLGCSKGRLVFIDKDSLEMLEFTFQMADWEEDVRAELSKLNEYWESGELPKAEPRAYKGKECQYCSYADACGRVENGHQ